MKRLLRAVTRTVGRLRRPAEAAAQAAPAKATPAKAAASREPTKAKAEQPKATSAKRGVPATASIRARGRLAYGPLLDGDADPGEVVWTWVAYEDDPSQGKDRPVVIVGRDGDAVLGLMLSSRADRERDRHWLALGSGAWDRRDRPSWVRLDRVLRIPSDGIRRGGAVLDRARFDRVAAALRRQHGWR